MAEAAKRSSANTDIYIGTLKASVGLFGTNAKVAGLVDFETAGPNGGALKYETRAAAAPSGTEQETQPVAPHSSDPLSGDASAPDVALAKELGQAGPTGPLPSVPPSDPLASTTGGGALVDGEFRQVLVEEGSGEVVEKADVRRGVRLEDGRFIDCTDQLAAIEQRTKLDRMDVVKCIDSTRIRRQRVVGARYVGAQDAGAKPVLRLLWETLLKRREVAVVKYSLRSRQYLGVIEADRKTGTLVLLDLVWSEDWRAAPEKATSIQKVEWRDEETFERQVGAMSALLEGLHDTVDILDDLRDDAIALREELHARAVAGELDALVVEPLPEAEPEPDLMAALQESLTAVRAGKL